VHVTFSCTLCHPPFQVIDQVNSFLAEKLASLFDSMEPVINKASPQLATLLNSSAVSSIAGLKKLPAVMGYLKKGAVTKHLHCIAECIKLMLPQHGLACTEVCARSSRGFKVHQLCGT